MRVALSEAAREEAKVAVRAGARLPSKERRPTGPVGGPDSVRDVFVKGPTSAALPLVTSSAVDLSTPFDPAAKEAVAAQVIAGKRIDARWLGDARRLQQPVGGRTSLALDWPDSSYMPTSPKREVGLRDVGPVLDVGGRAGTLYGGSAGGGGEAGVRPPSRHTYSWAKGGSSSGVSALMVHEEPGPGTAGAGAAAAAPRATIPRLRHQPVGGHGVAAAGIRSLDDMA